MRLRFVLDPRLPNHLGAVGRRSTVNVGVGLFVMGVALPFTVRLVAQHFEGLEPALDGLVQGLMHG